MGRKPRWRTWPECAGKPPEPQCPSNTPAGRNIGAPVTATDPEGDTLTYALGGADADSFAIIAESGQLQTKEPLDYETKRSYSVTVTASDGHGDATSIAVAINVTNVNESTTPTTTSPLDTTPTFDDGEQTTRRVAENSPAVTNVGAAVTASEADRDELTYALSGKDAASFDIDTATGRIKVKAALDYESKNSYAVQVTVRDGKDAGGIPDTEVDDAIAVTIRVTDVNEPPDAPEVTALSPASLVARWMAPANVGRPPITSYDVQHREGTTGDWQDGPQDVSGLTAAIADGAASQVRVRATNDEGDSPWSQPGSATTVPKSTVALIPSRPLPPLNSPPRFDDGEETVRSVPENSPAGTNVGALVTAMHAAGADFTYALAGEDAAAFDIDAATAQIKVRAALDYETKNTYAVKVTVRDNRNARTVPDTRVDDTIDVTINVIDVDESTTTAKPTSSSTTSKPLSPPSFTEGETATRTVPENTPVGTNVGPEVSAPDADLTYTLLGTDARFFDLDTTTGQIKVRAALDYETKSSYVVQVTVRDGKDANGVPDTEVDDTISVTINVTDVDEPAGASPTFAEGTATTRQVAENSPAGTNVGAPVEATVSPARVIKYTASGPVGALFHVDSATGQISVAEGAALDYKPGVISYTLTLEASAPTLRRSQSR